MTLQRHSAAAAMTALLLGGTIAAAQQAKPRVPAGRDPGGVAVAYIGPGIDYTDRQIASRLARDGEGEIVGWDFLDNDRRPYERCDGESRAKGTCASMRGLTIIQDAAAARLVVVRAAGERPQSLVEAFGLVAASPARVVLLSPASPGQSATIDARFLEEAAPRHPGLLIVVAAGVSQAAARISATMIVVTAADGPPAAGPADVIVPTADAPAQKHEIAAARVAALAVRLLAVEPLLDAAAIKARIVGLAVPAPAKLRAIARHGWIEHPEDHFARR